MEMPVKMVRDAKAFPESHEANVRPENVAEFEAMGWSAAGAAEKPAVIPSDWQSLTAKKRVALAKALGWVDGEPTTEQADGWIADIIVQRERAEPREDLGGRSLQEVHAVLTAKGVEWDAETSPADLLALYELAQAE